MTRIALLLACILLQSSGGALAAGPQQIFIVRHAEKSVTTTPPAGGNTMTAPGDDPPLSPAGHERAARLSSMLSSAGIRHVICTEFARTRQTAAPAARALHIDPVSIAAKDTDALVSRLDTLQGNVLVVGHSNSVGILLKRLGIRDEITIAESEYDNLFVVVRSPAGEPSLVRLRY